MLSEELVDLAACICRVRSETQTIAVRAAHLGAPTWLYDTLSSFSNQDGGGVVLFGVDGEAGFVPVGVYDVQELRRNVTEQCGQMLPPVCPLFTVAEYEGCTICSAELPGLDTVERPCYYAGTGRTQGPYVRVGTANLPMTDYERYALEAFRRQIHEDVRPAERAQLALLNPDKLDDYLFRMRAEKPGLANLSWEQTMELLSLTRNQVPTLAAVLNFGICPQGYFPQLALTAVVVPGEEMGETDGDHARFLDNRRIEGTLAEMLQGGLAFCQRNLKRKTVTDPCSGERRDSLGLPLEAVREALLNALIHRDYSWYTEGTPIQMDLFSDRLEIHSPGGLYGTLSVEQLGCSTPRLRNPTLAAMAGDLLGAKNQSSGIPAMRAAMARAGLPEPVFRSTLSEFVVTLYLQAPSPAPTDPGPGMGTRSDWESNLLRFCAVPRTRGEITSFLKLKTPYYAMQHYVKPLLEHGTLLLLFPDRPRCRDQKYCSAVRPD